MLFGRAQPFARLSGARWPRRRLRRALCRRLPPLERADTVAALRQHVGIAAGIFGPSAVALRRDHRGDRAVEEVAVVAHEEERARIGGEHLLQQIERLEVEIVGRLVEHHEIRGLRQSSREQQAAFLAARQRLDGGLRLLGLEQKVPHVADDVAGLAVDDHRIAAPAGERRGNRGVGVEAFAPLVEGGDLEIGAELHLA